MADPPGLLGNLFPGNNPAALYEGLLSDPVTQQQMNQRALAAMAGSFAESAMPTRVPTPFGAVLGRAAAAAGPAQDAIMAARLQAAEAQQQLALSHLTQQKVSMIPEFQNAFQEYLQTGGGGGGIPGGIPQPGAPGLISIPGAGPAPYGGGRGAMFTPEQIAAAATANGLDPELVNTVVGIESSHGANTNNTKSPSNTGLFQMAPANAPGGMNDEPQNQLQIGLNALYKEKAELGGILGRDPTNAEVYLAHQQGVRGAAALLLNPAKPAGEVTRPINISNNGGNPNQPASVFTDYWNNRYAHFSAPYAAQASRPVQLASAGSGTGLLNQQPAPGGPPPASAGAVPPLSPETKQFMRDKGMSEEAIARVDGALAGPSPGTPPGPTVAPPAGPAAAPPPMVTPPGAAAAVPPITRPQVAAAPPLQAAPPGVMPGIVPSAPSPAKIRAAQQLNYLWPMVFGGQAPAEISETASWDIKTAEAVRDAQIKLGSTATRVPPGGGISIGGAPPTWFAPTPTTVYNPVTERPEIASQQQRPGGGPPIISTTGVPSAPSEREKSTGQTLGQYPTGPGVPGEPTGPRGYVPGGVDPAMPIPSPANVGRGYQTVIPSTAQQARTPDIHTYGQAQPDWQKESGDLADAGIKAQNAEVNLMGIVKAYQMVETGTWAMQKAEFAGVLKALNLPVPDDAAGLAALQTGLHNLYKETLQDLAGANKRFTGNEFKVNTEAGASAGNQPAANLTLLSQDLGRLRQIQALAGDWNRAQTITYSDGSRWVNPDSFKTAWIQNNPLQPMVNQSRQEIGWLGGTVPAEMPPGTKALPLENGRPRYQLPDGQIIRPKVQPNG